jgi:Rieske Fe-S protein
MSGGKVFFRRTGEEATMRRLLLVLVVLAAGVGGLGYARGWFTVSSSDNKDKTIPVEVKVDRGKVKEDAEKARAKVNDVTGRDKAKAGEPATGKKEAATKGPGGE